jgi:hypothetical protein
LEKALRPRQRFTCFALPSRFYAWLPRTDDGASQLASSYPT